MAKTPPIYQCRRAVYAHKIKSIIKAGGATEQDPIGGFWEIIPEEAGYEPYMVPFAWLDKHKPQVGGYVVMDLRAPQTGEYISAKRFEEDFDKVA